MRAFYDLEREYDGWPKLSAPGGGPPSEDDAFARRCYLNGVTDAGAIAELRAREVAKRESAQNGAGRANQAIGPKGHRTKKGRR